MEKIINVCCEKYLEESGISSVLVGNEISGPQVVKLVMEGSHQVLEKRGILIIAESMVHLQLSAFFNAVNANKYEDLFFELTQLQSLFHAADINLNLISVSCSKFEDEIAEPFRRFRQIQVNWQLQKHSSAGVL